jgi:hypothetical protein
VCTRENWKLVPAIDKHYKRGGEPLGIYGTGRSVRDEKADLYTMEEIQRAVDQAALKGDGSEKSIEEVEQLR